MGLRQPPQGAPNPQFQPQSQPSGGQESPGNAAKLAANIFSEMGQLLDIMEQSQAASPEDKQQFASIIQSYQGFIENNLGSAPGQRPQGPKPMPGPASMEAGVNPGARPMPM